MSLLAPRYDFAIDQGASFSRTFTVVDPDTGGTPVNLTGYTGRAQIRLKYADADGSQPLSSVNTTDGGLSINGSTGTVTFSLSPGTTQSLPAQQLVYDIELVNGGTIIKLVRGFVDVRAEVTR